MAYPVKVIGIGPGSPDFLLPQALKEASLCSVLIGSARALQLFPTEGKETRLIDKNLKELLTYIQQKRSSELVGILVSGDPGFYSLLAYLKKHLSPGELEVIPGISSLQVAFSRLRLTWQDAQWLSLHGRPLENLLPYLNSKKTLGLLVDKNCSLGEIVRMLNKAGIWRIHVCGNLTYPDEFILTFNSQEKVPRVDLENCVLVVEPDEGK